MALPPIPTDINAAPSSLRFEFRDKIETLIDAAEPRSTPSGGNDLLLGTDLSQTINGGSGNDVIAGFGGNDSILGGFGDDYLLGGLGNDRLSGGDGNDFLFGEAGNDVLAGSAGDDALFGGAGTDSLSGGDGNDWLFANSGNDTLTGGLGDDIAYGGTGANTITGGAGNDELRGSSGNDVIDGGVDNDFIEGGSGADRLTGGVGDDMYYYASRTHGGDTILDFESSQDRFEFRGLGFGVDPGTNLDAGVTFIAGAAPKSVVAQATVLYNTATGQLYFDIDGTGASAAQLIATISGAPTVTEQDFIFV